MQFSLPFGGEPEPPGARLAPVSPPTSPAESIQFVRTPRAKRYVLRVKPDGTLRVTVPSRGSRSEALRFVERQQAWIERERRQVATRIQGRKVVHGSSLLLRGASVTVAVQQVGSTRTVAYGGREVVIASEGADLTAALERDLRLLARHELVPRLLELASRHGLSVKRVTIRNQRSRWGSCSRVGAITLNYRLVQMPPDVRDYVLLHELMHLKQQNHSRRFWRLVEAACPAFREAEQWLKTAGRVLL